MSFFDRDFLEFFRELDTADNNNKVWFDANRKRYLKVVKQPFQNFIQELIFRLQDEDDELSTDPKESIFRINRDLRFSKDKTPYKLHTSAAMSTGGRKAADSPGYYIQLTYNRISLGGGLYNPSKNGLHSIRSYIMNNPTELLNLTKEKSFVDTYKELLGKKNKRMPSEFVDAFKKKPKSFIDNKSFYYFRETNDAQTILQPDLIDQIITIFRAGMKINSFLHKALR